MIRGAACTVLMTWMWLVGSVAGCASHGSASTTSIAAGGGGGAVVSGGGGGAGGVGSTTSPPLPDSDGDGVADPQDNCVDTFNPSQADYDEDGLGDACTFQDGTVGHPFIIPGDPLLPDYVDSRDTHDALSDVFDSYPGADSIDESGPEYVYVTALPQRTEVRASIRLPEPDGTDIDVHLLSSLDPPALLARDNDTITTVLDPGRYFFTLDTYVAGGAPQLGPYQLAVALQAWHAGTVADPMLPGEDPVGSLSLPFVYRDSRDTHDAVSDGLDSYPGFEQIDESGSEVIYRFSLAEPARLAATIDDAEPAGTDIDLHLLSSLDPPVLVTRGNTAIYAVVEPGTYYLVMDTYVSAGAPQLGAYNLWLSVRPRALPSSSYFNETVLSAVDYLWAQYRLLGYDSAVLTHDVPYGTYGMINASAPPKTMCVAAAMEVILTAMNIWAEDTGDQGVFDFLPKASWETLSSDHIKAHIWVNHSLDSYGTADALGHFGMGENVPFEQLAPGSFINLNRTTGTGHAVVFLSFLDLAGNELSSHGPGVVGFKYISSQGGYEAGAGGFDYRYAVFAEYGSPAMPGKRDINVIESSDQKYLNTGMMWSPDHWVQMDVEPAPWALPTVFDAKVFTGRTVDDDDAT